MSEKTKHPKSYRTNPERLRRQIAVLERLGHGKSQEVTAMRLAIAGRTHGPTATGDNDELC